MAELKDKLVDLEDLAIVNTDLQNKVANLKSSLELMEATLETHENVNFSSETVYNYLIGSNSVWTGGGTRYSYNVQVPDGATEVTIKTQTNVNTFYTLLTSNTHLNGSSPDYCTGYTGRIAIAANSSVTIDIQSDCKYIYIFKTSDGTDHTPAEMVFATYIDITEIQNRPTDTVLYGTAQSLTNGQKTQARGNIEAAWAQDVEAIMDKLKDEESVDFQTETVYNYLIGSNNLWSGSGSRYSYNVQVPDGATEVTIKTQTNVNTFYTLLTSNTHLNGSSPDYCTGYTGRIAIAANSSVTIDIQSDCKYIYIFKTSDGTDHTPAEMTFKIEVNINGIRSDVKENHDSIIEVQNDIGEIQNDIGEIQDEIDDIQDEIQNISSPIPSQIFNVDLRNANEYSIMSTYNASLITADGYVPAAGWENRVVINKYVVCDDIKYRANISLATAGSGVCVLGTQSLAGSDGNHATLVKFDFGNALVSFLTGSSAAGGGNIDGKSIPEYTYDSFSLENLSGTEYRIEIGRTKRAPYAKVYNLTTGTLCGEKSLMSVYETASSYGGKAGVMYDVPNFGVLDGTITFRRVSASVPTGVFAMFIGDSITEGSSIAWSDTWANKAIMHLGTGINCGRGSGSITHATRCAEDILPAVFPKYVIVTIGTNGGVTLAKLNNLISIIKKAGAVPIVNRIPMNNRSGASATATVNAIVKTLNVDSAKFDIATATNNDPAQGQNSSLFVSDQLHPNAAGGIAMYNQFIADVGWIKPDDWTD